MPQKARSSKSRKGKDTELINLQQLKNEILNGGDVVFVRRLLERVPKLDAIFIVILVVVIGWVLMQNRLIPAAKLAPALTNSTSDVINIYVLDEVLKAIDEDAVINVNNERVERLVFKVSWDEDVLLTANNDNNLALAAFMSLGTELKKQVDKRDLKPTRHAVFVLDPVGIPVDGYEEMTTTIYVQKPETDELAYNGASVLYGADGCMGIRGVPSRMRSDGTKWVEKYFPSANKSECKMVIGQSRMRKYISLPGVLMAALDRKRRSWDASQLYFPLGGLTVPPNSIFLWSSCLMSAAVSLTVFFITSKKRGHDIVLSVAAIPLFALCALPILLAQTLSIHLLSTGLCCVAIALISAMSKILSRFSSNNSSANLFFDALLSVICAICIYFYPYSFAPLVVVVVVSTLSASMSAVYAHHIARTKTLKEGDLDDLNTTNAFLQGLLILFVLHYYGFNEFIVGENDSSPKLDARLMRLCVYLSFYPFIGSFIGCEGKAGNVSNLNKAQRTGKEIKYRMLRVWFTYRSQLIILIISCLMLALSLTGMTGAYHHITCNGKLPLSLDMCTYKPVNTTNNREAPPEPSLSLRFNEATKMLEAETDCTQGLVLYAADEEHTKYFMCKESSWGKKQHVELWTNPGEAFKFRWLYGVETLAGGTARIKYD